ncbi:MAG: TVP38/TMEM64 family protein [Candidatus Promineifilaceae bacterium]
MSSLTDTKNKKKVGLPQPYIAHYLTPQKGIWAGTSNQPQTGWQSWHILAGIIIFTLALILIWQTWEPAATLMTLISDQEAVSQYLKSYGALGPIVLAIVQFIQVLAAVIPGHVFIIAAGYVYGFVPAFLMNWLFVVLASQLGFTIAQWAGRPFINKLAPPDLVNKWQAIAEEQGFAFFTIAFLLPVFPTDIMNFVAGLTGMSQKKFFAANALGRMPGVIMLTLIGSHGLELTPTAWGIMGTIVAAFYLTGRIFVTRLEKRLQAQNN